MRLADKISVMEFEAWVQEPDQADRLFEFIDGEVVEVPSNPYASYIAGRLFRRVADFVESHALGYTTGEAGGYKVSGERYAPDVGFISKTKQPKLATSGYNPTPPDLAVEVDFPSTLQSQRQLRTKIVNYLAAGTVVWLVLPESEEVEVYIPGQPKQTLDRDGILDGGTVLVGFSVAVRDIFPIEKE